MNCFRQNAERRLWPLLITMFLFFAALAAQAQITWQSSYANGNLKQWSQVQCGGQGTTCPCAPPSNPSGAANYTEGSCSTNSTGQFPQPADGSGRYQLVTPPAGQTGTALKINLQHNDYWLTDWTRNEVLGPQETPGTATYYGDGDDRYFAWSTWFDPASFASFNCGSSTCSSNPWNVFTQFHQAGDNYSTPMSFVLRASASQPGKYQMQYLTKDVYDNNDNEHIQYKWDPLPTGVWNDFVLHVHFGTTASTGLVELWYGVNGGAKTQLTLACPDSSGTPRNLTSCPTTTLYIWPAPGDYNYYASETYSPRTPGTAMPVILKQGLYRQNDILDNVTLYHTDMVIGKTFADVAGSGGGGGGGGTGQLTLTIPLGLSPSSPGVNQSTTATFTVQNTGTGPASVQYFLAGARDPSNGNVDFPASSAVTLQAGQSYTYSGSRTFSTAGAYSAWPSYYDGTNWIELAPSHTSFSVTGTPPLFSDDFNRTTGLGTNWSILYGSYSTNGTQAVSGTPPTNGNWAGLNAALGTNDYSVSSDMIVPSGSLYSGLVARSSDSANVDRNLYSAQIATDGNVYLYRRNEWNWTQLASAAGGIVAGTSYNVKLLVSGSSPVHLEVWLNGVQEISFDDSSPSQITTGVAGMENYDANVLYDNFTVTTP